MSEEMSFEQMREESFKTVAERTVTGNDALTSPRLAVIIAVPSCPSFLPKLVRRFRRWH